MAAFIQLLDKASIRDTNLSSPPTLAPADQNASNNVLNLPVKAVPFKKYFDVLNLTLHDRALHDSFFESNRFMVTSIDIEDSEEFPLNAKNFSDSGVPSLFYFRDMMYSRHQKFKTMPPSLVNVTFDPRLPNNFKAYHYSAQSNAPGAGASAGQPIRSVFSKNVFQHLESKKYTAFKFLNFNMTAQIQVFKGRGKNINTELWVPLTSNELEFDQKEGKILFCRIVYFEQKMLGEMQNVPIVDKYFLISHMLPGYSVTPTASPETALPPVAKNVAQKIGAKIAEGMSEVTVGAEAIRQTTQRSTASPSRRSRNMASSTARQTSPRSSGRSAGGGTGGRGGY